MASSPGSGVGIALLVLAGVLAAGMLFVWLSYLRPRAEAIRKGKDWTDVWMGLGTLVLWNPGETFVFQRNKQFEGTGGERGGLRVIYPLRGQQAMGPIALKTAMQDWHAVNVMTREAQQLNIRMAAWWRVSNLEKYAFRIYQEKRQGGELPVHGVYTDQQIRETAVEWLQAMTDAALRSHVNRLSVGEVVSAQATRFLQETGDGGSFKPTGDSDARFDAAIQGVLKEVRRKLSEYGIELESLEVQHIDLPPAIQEAIDETRVAFLEPIKSAQQAEAVKIKLTKLAEVLGADTVGLNELLKNLKGATFVTPLTPFQDLVSAVDQRASRWAGQAPQPAAGPAIAHGEITPAATQASTNVPTNAPREGGGSPVSEHSQDVSGSGPSFAHVDTSSERGRTSEQPTQPAERQSAQRREAEAPSPTSAEPPIRPQVTTPQDPFEPQVCPKCGEPVSHGDKYCGDCGQRLGG